MADGDPILIVSEELLTNAGFETFDTGLAVGWTKADAGGSSAVASDNSEERSGTYCQKVTQTGEGCVTTLTQVFSLTGRADNTAKNVGMTVAISVYAKRGSSSGNTVKMRITEQDAAGVDGSTADGAAVSLSASYQQAVKAYTIQDADCAKLKVTIVITDAIGGRIAYIDDASLAIYYTCTTNPTDIKYKPTLPEQSANSINNTYYRQRNASTAMKYRDMSLTFGICDNTQKNVLFQITQQDKTFTIYPYNPDLPASLTGKFKPMGMPSPLGKRWNIWSTVLEFNEI